MKGLQLAPQGRAPQPGVCSRALPLGWGVAEAWAGWKREGAAGLLPGGRSWALRMRSGWWGSWEVSGRPESGLWEVEAKCRFSAKHPELKLQELHGGFKGGALESCLPWLSSATPASAPVIRSKSPSSSPALLTASCPVPRDPGHHDDNAI